MNITFELLRSVCRYTGCDYKDDMNCNHSNYSYQGELEGYGEDAGYMIRSDMPCGVKNCPFLDGSSE